MPIPDFQSIMLSLMLYASDEMNIRLESQLSIWLSSANSLMKRKQNCCQVASLFLITVSGGQRLTFLKRDCYPQLEYLYLLFPNVEERFLIENRIVKT